ncbi:MAG TPA: rhodanese-like domain-containing protein, partial [Pseudobdellovibrionaceae bacterium]|nr:rhodanese-like domain-containing protein [Pseudobdellovibrionaceae bacterium]
MSVALNAKINWGIPEITPKQTLPVVGKVRIIDVRTPEEYAEGHIVGSELIPLGPEVFQLLTNGDRNQQIIVVCRTGNRAGHVTQLALERGFREVY